MAKVLRLIKMNKKNEYRTKIKIKKIMQGYSPKKKS